MTTKPKQQKPVVGGNLDTWGGVLNQNIDIIDNFASAVVDELGTHSQELAWLEQDKINIADLDTVVTDRVDNYIETDAKPQLDAYINDEKKPELDAYTVQKKSDINNYVETVSKVSINDFTEVQKTELNTHELLKESELDAHELLKESELDSHTLAKQTQLDTYEDSKEAELEVFTVTKKAEINTYKDSMNSEINLFTEANKIEITEHTDNKKVELDTHESAKELQLDTYTIVKESQIDVYTLNKKGEIDTKTEEEKLELDAYNEVKKGQLDTHETSKEAQLDAYETSKEGELESFTTVKKAEMNTYKDSMNSEVNLFAEGKKVEITQHTDTKKGELDTYEKSKEAQLDTFTTAKEGQIDIYVASKKGEIDTKTESEKAELDTYNELKKGQLDTHETAKEVQLDTYADGRETEMTAHADAEIARINATGLDGKVDKTTYNADKIVIDNSLAEKVDKTTYASDKAIMEGNINSKLDATAFDSYSVIAGKGTTGGGKLSVNPVVDVVALDDSMVIENDGIKVNTVDDLVTGGIKRPLSAAQGKWLKDYKIEDRGFLGVIDLDTLTSSSQGLWYQDFNGSATLGRNYPQQGLQSGCLLVLKTGPYETNCVQEYITYYSNKKFRRVYTGDAPSEIWGSWVECFDSNNPQPLDTQDTLTSTSTTKPLSANMGKVLQDTKLNLTGGTVTNGTNEVRIGVKYNNLSTDTMYMYTNSSSQGVFSVMPGFSDAGVIRRDKITGFVTYASGTFTGALNGSTATFSGNVTAPRLTMTSAQATGDGDAVRYDFANSTYFTNNPKAIPANTNLNTFLTKGHYTSDGNANTSTMTNTPFETNSFTLVIDGIGSGYITQFATRFYDCLVSCRTTYNYGATWTDWKNIATTLDVETAFENGVGADVLGYIEDGGTHTAGTVWLSKYNKGEFECKIQNSDNYVESTKWKKIDDKSNSDRLDNLLKLIYPSYTLSGVFNDYNKSFTNGKVINIGIGSSGIASANLSVGDTCLIFDNMVCEVGIVMVPFSSKISKGGVITFTLSETGIVKIDAIFNVNGESVTTTGLAPSFYAILVSVLK